MKTLEQYLATAKNYLYPECANRREQDVKAILEFVKKHNLEDSFNRQVKENQSWRTLSATSQVYYYIESSHNREHFNINSPWRLNVQPQITLMFWSGRRDPVIKIVMP